MPFLKKPLVVGAPRSGFSLLISVIQNLMNRSGVKPARSYRQTVINRVVDLAGYYTTNKYRATCARLGITRDLVLSGEFHLVVNDGLPSGSIAIRPQAGLHPQVLRHQGPGRHPSGDVTILAVLDYDDVVHSHTAPGLWEQRDAYDSYVKFTSIRNPVGIINSAAFSLNAMASEYIQKFLPEESEDHIRLRHGLYKLTDLEFFAGLVRFLKNYLDDYLPWRDRYLVMKWEDLITRPAQVICWVAKGLGLECSEKEALALWAPMDHVNLLRFHKHNYRRGRGIVGDWKNSLVTRACVDIFRDLRLRENTWTSWGIRPCPGSGAASTRLIRNWSPVTCSGARSIATPAIRTSSASPSTRRISTPAVLAFGRFPRARGRAWSARRWRGMSWSSPCRIPPRNAARKSTIFCRRSWKLASRRGTTRWIVCATWNESGSTS